MGALKILPTAGLSAARLEAMPLLDVTSRPDGVTLAVAVCESQLDGTFHGPDTAGSTVCTLLQALPETDGPVLPADESLFAGAQFNTSALYHAIKPTGKEAEYELPVPGLKAVLHPFQVCSCEQFSPKHPHVGAGGVPILFVAGHRWLSIDEGGHAAAHVELDAAAGAELASQARLLVTGEWNVPPH